MEILIAALASWPAMMAMTIVVLVVVVLVMFHGQLAQKLSRMTRAGRDGFQFEQHQQLPDVKPEALPAALGGEAAPDSAASGSVPTAALSGATPEVAGGMYQQLMQLPITASVLEREKVIHGRVAGFDLNNEQLKEVLIRGLASANVDLEFMRTALLIYGSQLNLLVALSGRVGGMPRGEAEALFNSVKESWPMLKRTFEEWLGFLVRAQFIVEANGHVGHVDITQVGTDFLKFLLDQRLAHERAG